MANTALGVYPHMISHGPLYWSVHLSGYVKVGEGCELGTKTTVIQDKELGAWSVIGAGSVVVDDIPGRCTAVGVPARPIKFYDK